MIKIACMAKFPHPSIDFLQISRAGHNFSCRTQGEGVVLEVFTGGKEIVFKNLTPGHVSFSNFPAAPPRMFADQVPSPTPLPQGSAI